MFGRAVRIGLLLLGVCGMLLAADLPGVWLDVPFVKQEKDGCGAASIAMVMQYWQAPAGSVAEPRFRRDPYSARTLFGQSPRHLCFRYGALLPGAGVPHVYNSRRVGRPPTASRQGTSLDRCPEARRRRRSALCGRRGTGSRKLVMVNDPAQRKLLQQDRSSFEREWSAAGKWTLLALPQNQSR